MKSIGIHLLRHYPYIDNPESREFREIVLKENRGIRLSEEEIRRSDELDLLVQHVRSYHDLPERVRYSVDRVMYDPKNTLLCYDPTGSRRELDTANDLIRTFSIKNVERINIPRLRDQSDLGFVARFKQAVRAILVQAERAGNIQEVVLVGRRSYSHAFARFAECPGDVQKHRFIIEEEGVISCRMHASPKIAEIYDFLKILRIAASRREAEKIMRASEILINGTPVESHRDILVCGDLVDYKGDTFIIGVDKTGAPEAKPFLQLPWSPKIPFDSSAKPVQCGAFGI